MSRLSPQEEITLLRKKARRRLVGAITLVAIAITVLWNTMGKKPQQVQPEQIAVVPENASNAQAQQPPVSPSSTPLTIQEPEQHPASTPVAVAPVTTQPQTRLQAASATTPAEDPAAKAAQEKAEREKAEKAEKEKRAAEEKARLEKEKAAARAKEEQQPKPADKPKKPEPDPAALLDGRADAGKQTNGVTTVANTTSATPSKKVMIQLPALSDQAKIDSMKSKLNSLGVNASFSKVQTSKGEATRVRVGPFANRAEADAAMAKLSRVGLSGIVLP